MEGHRARLRQHFAEGHSLSDIELLELVLSFAIPRRDVAPLAEALLGRFGSIRDVLQAPHDALTSVTGIGANSALLITLIAQFIERSSPDMTDTRQDTLWPDTEYGEQDASESEPEERPLRTFGNDEIKNTLRFLPEAPRFESYDAFRNHLERELPYNAATTRVRRASYILNRFFPGETLDTPLALFASACDAADLKVALFYEMLRAEPLAARVAEEVVWPALPRGFADRAMIRECIMRHLPDIKKTSLTKTLRSTLNTYSLLNVGVERDGGLLVEMHAGTLAGFLYVLTAEYPKPGMYTFASLDAGPLHRWLLWDRGWMHRQLYLLRERGILAKVSEIDTMKQFTLAWERQEALQRYFSPE